MEEEKKLKVTVDFGSSLKFWLAYLIVQIIAVLIAVAVLIGLLGLIVRLLPGIFPSRTFMTLAQSLLSML